MPVRDESTSTVTSPPSPPQRTSLHAPAPARREWPRRTRSGVGGTDRLRRRWRRRAGGNRDRRAAADSDRSHSAADGRCSLCSPGDGDSGNPSDGCRYCAGGGRHATGCGRRVPGRVRDRERGRATGPAAMAVRVRANARHPAGLRDHGRAPADARRGRLAAVGDRRRARRVLGAAAGRPRLGLPAAAGRELPQRRVLDRGGGDGVLRTPRKRRRDHRAAQVPVPQQRDHEHGGHGRADGPRHHAAPESRVHHPQPAARIRRDAAQGDLRRGLPRLRRGAARNRPLPLRQLVARPGRPATAPPRVWVAGVQQVHGHAPFVDTSRLPLNLYIQLQDLRFA